MDDLMQRRSAEPDARAEGLRQALDTPELHVNRELSWLEFNRRVLAQATDASTPLLERVRFIAIFGSNLDEFFMVRVAGLRRQVEAGVTRRTPDGRTPAEQLDDIAERLHPMVVAAVDCLHDQLLPLLTRQGVHLLDIGDLDDAARRWLDRYFDEEVFPVLTPLAVDPAHPFPYISNMSMSLAVTVHDEADGQRHFARVKVPGVLPRFVALPDDVPHPGTHALVALEDLIRAHLGRLFPGLAVEEAYGFRVTRNSDLDLEEEEGDDLLLAIQQELRRRRFGAVVRLEVSADMPERVLRLLQDELDVDGAATYQTTGLLGQADLAQLADLDLPALKWEPWHPVQHPRLAPARTPTPGDVFAEIRRGDILVHHPYDSFGHTVERFVAAASEDPGVLAIKQTLYRTSGDSRIVQDLIRAAERGKQVVALVELKARFDEEANISWARVLEKAGVHVVYGLVGLKTHAKTTLVVRREPEGLRRYVHIGTGNYNARTATLYTDLGLFSADPGLGADLTDLFNVLTGYSRQGDYRRVLVAPSGLRDRCAELIRGEIEAHERGERQGLIRLKVNSLIDPQLVTELYRASQAGVRVDLVVRSICGLRPGLPGVSDRIRVTSIVGRLLEHARIWQFGPDDFWIGSADWMPRNLDRRIEVMAPVCDPPLREELRQTLDIMLADNLQAWTLEPDASWTPRSPGDEEVPLSSQERLHARARARNARAGLGIGVV